MNELAYLAKKKLRDARVKVLILILEGLAQVGLLPSDLQLANNAQPVEMQHGV